MMHLKMNNFNHMKKILKFILLLSLVLSSFLSCSDSGLQDKFDSLEARVSALEKLSAQLNTNISAIQTVITALQNNDFITSVSEIKEGDRVIGYTINFSKSGNITLYHGEEGETPVIGVKPFSDGLYYWTVNGDWLMDVEGDKIKAQGEDGITPRIKIENMSWMLSIDNGETWTSLGTAAGGDSIFQSVTQDTDYIYLSLIDGTLITLPKERALSITLNETADIPITAGETKTLSYTISGATEETIVKAIGQNGWSAEVIPSDHESGTITVSAPNPLVEDEVIVLVYDGETRTVMNSINFITGTITVASQVYPIPRVASSVEVNIDANIDYVVDIPHEAQEWLSVSSIAARSTMRHEAITFNFTANRRSARYATVSLKNNAGTVLRTIGFEQASGATYRLTVQSSPAGGASLAGSGDHVEGETVTITATSGNDYTFKGWAANMDLFANADATTTTIVMPGQNITVTANFEEGTFTDSRDGTEYGYVTIGDQVWMAENLKYLPAVTGPRTGSGNAPHYYVYDYDGTHVTEAKATDNYRIYGVLYNWTAAMNGAASSSSNPSGVQGACPDGWHLPSDTEWEQLINYVGDNKEAANKLKEFGTTHWWSNVQGNNATGFTALPGGHRNSNGEFFSSRQVGYWWSATDVAPANTGSAYPRYLSYNNSEVFRTSGGKSDGMSVRCIRD